MEVGVANPTVLVVDDNPLITNVLTSVLHSENYCVIVAANGEEALEKLNAHDIDIIICDVMMPRMDGYQLHEAIRTRVELSHIPFLFLTALSDTTEIDRGRETGADDYLTKPFDPRTLLSIVRGKVARSRQLREQLTQRYEIYRKRVVHTLSHEFRTPLVAINTGAELLLDHRQTLGGDKEKQLLEAVRRGGQRLERLVTDFMMLQQLEAGTSQKVFALRGRRETLSAIVNRYVDAEQGELARDGFSFTVSDRSDGAAALVYEPYVLDILRRLIGNAVKFKKDDRRIEIELYRRDNDGVIEVRDRGVGIDVLRLREALSMFGQLDREKVEQQGSGVGLTIAARLAQLHGGSLEFQKREGGGTVVRLVLPILEDEPTGVTERSEVKSN